MIFLYLIFGFLALSAAGSTPAESLEEIQASSGRAARPGEIAAAVAVWCVAVSVWPLAIVIRGVRALTAEARRSRH